MVIVGIYKTKCNGFLVNFIEPPSSSIKEVYLKDLDALLSFISDNFKDCIYD